MRLSELVNFQSNKQRLDAIRQNRENIVPFVGAGISKGCGLYAWQELLDKLAVESFMADEIQQLKADKDVFEYADEIVNATGNTEINLTEMPYFNIVAETNENIVVIQYVPVTKCFDVYQSEAALKEFLLCA